jgi:hypothetical protein
MRDRMTAKRFNDGRSCSICGNLKTIYHEWDCMGTWTCEVECTEGYNLEETNGTDCEDFWHNTKRYSSGEQI